MYSEYYNVSTMILQVHYGIVSRMAAALHVGWRLTPAAESAGGREGLSF